MATAHELLIDTVFMILAISVLAGGFAALLSEFGVIHLLNQIISPLIKTFIQSSRSSSSRHNYYIFK